MIHIDGHFGGRTEQKVDRLLEALPQDAWVVIDFKRVNAYDDVALEHLAARLRGTARHVELRGLTQDHIRILAYLGLPEETLHDGHVAVKNAAGPAPLNTTRYF